MVKIYIFIFLDMENLVVVPASQQSCDQRAGRSGRVTGFIFCIHFSSLAGKCFRLCTQSAFNQLEVTTKAEIERTNISVLILTLMGLGIRNLLEFEFLSPPDLNTIKTNLQLLYSLNAINLNGELTYEVGYKLVELPLAPKLATILINSGIERQVLIFSATEKYKCCYEILALISMLSVQNLFLSQK